MYCISLPKSDYVLVIKRSSAVRLSILAAIAGIGALAAPLWEDLASAGPVIYKDVSWRIGRPLLSDSNMKIVEAACKAGIGRLGAFSA